MSGIAPESATLPRRRFSARPLILMLAGIALVFGASGFGLLPILNRESWLETRSTTRRVFEGIELIGDEQFCENTAQALIVLRLHDNENFRMVQRYVGRIRSAEHSGMRAYESPPTFEVGDPTAQASRTWYAGSIVHDATHSRLYHEYADNHDGPVPDTAWMGRAIEKKCCEVQIESLRRIHAPQSELDWCEKNSDGAYSDVDYSKRNW